MIETTKATAETLLKEKEYLKPHEHSDKILEQVRTKKEEDVALREQLSKEVRDEYPDASIETLNAIVTRRIYELGLKARVPEDPELTLKPDMSRTLKKVQERICYHNGKYEERKFGQKEGKDGKKKMAWSCCQNKEKDSEGCVVKIVDKQKWVLTSA